MQPAVVPGVLKEFLFGIPIYRIIRLLVSNFPGFRSSANLFRNQVVQSSLSTLNRRVRQYQTSPRSVDSNDAVMAFPFIFIRYLS